MKQRFFNPLKRILVPFQFVKNRFSSTREKRCNRLTNTEHTKLSRELSSTYKDFKEVTQVHGTIETKNKVLIPSAVLQNFLQGESYMKNKQEALRGEYTDVCKNFLEKKQELDDLRGSKAQESHNDTTVTDEATEANQAEFETDKIKEKIFIFENPPVYSGLPKQYDDYKETETVVFMNYLNGHLTQGAKRYLHTYLHGVTYEVPKRLEKLKEETKATKNSLLTISLYIKKVLIILFLTFLFLVVGDSINILELIAETWNMGDIERWFFIGIPLALSIGFCIAFLKEIRKWLYSDLSRIWHVPRSILLLVFMGVSIVILFGILNADTQRLNDQLEAQQMFETTDDSSFPADNMNESVTNVNDDEAYTPQFGWVNMILYPLLALFFAIGAGVFEAFCMVIAHRMMVIAQFRRIQKRKRAIEKEYDALYVDFDRLPKRVEVIITLLGKISVLETFMVNPITKEDLDKVFAPNTHKKNLDTATKVSQNGSLNFNLNKQEL